MLAVGTLIGTSFFFLKPVVSQGFYDLALTQLMSENSEDVKEAINNFNKVLLLQPDFVNAYHHRGWAYEKIGDFENARKNYETAMKGDLDDSFSQLARLYILGKVNAKNSKDAIKLLEPRLAKLSEIQNKYTMLKNLGWAHLKENQYNKAKNYLKQAVEIINKQEMEDRNASAYCLLAELFDKERNILEAERQWNECFRYAREYRTPEEKQWLKIIRDKKK
jgi:Tfp pilus assembly protein PilF